MSLLEKIKSWFGAGEGSHKAICVVDAAVLMGANRPGGRLSPREQIQILRKLSMFAEREGFDVLAVFEGHPLREVGHGEDFGARVKVFFCDSSAAVQDMVRKLAAERASRKPIVVVANRKSEEEIASLGVRVMRGNTFRKGVELALSGGGGDSNARQEPSQRGPEKRRHRGRGPRREPRGAGQPAQQTTGAGEAASGGPVSGGPREASAPTTGVPAQKPPVDDAVRSMIDLVE